MREQFTQELAGLHAGARNRHVVGAGCWVSAGVVVDNDQRGGVAPDSSLEHLADAYLGA